MKFGTHGIGTHRARLVLLPTLVMVGCLVGQSQTPTNVQITSAVQQPLVHRLGVNLGDQGYWDSGQMLKNLVFQNPGFEGLKYRSILKCALVTANTCTDDNQYSSQPTGFWSGGSYEIMSGASKGLTGKVVSSTKNPKACSGCGQIIQFDQNVNAGVGDYFVMTNAFPGGGDTGWWDTLSGGAVISTEMNDLSPNTPGKQALLMSATGAGQAARVTQYFESFKGLSFIQLNGNFQVAFRAKGVGGKNQLNVSVQRLMGTNAPYLNQTLTLTNSWQDYTLDFSANETGSAVGTVQLVFGAAGSSVELDDVSLQQTNSSPSNPTAFRDDVVNALKQLKPGTIRMMAAGAALGSDIPNQLAPPFARYREGFNSSATISYAIPYGIHEFLELCAVVGADPWITIPTATSAQEMKDFMEYLTGNGSDSYSASRIARGQSQPWTSVFNKIHIELGNETWNGVFKGESMAYPGYPLWANDIFGAARQSSGYQAGKFDLVLDGWAAVPGYNAGLLSYSTQHDSIDIAPYLLYSANNEAQSTLFGALFAQPELFNNATGEVTRTLQAAALASTPTTVNVYETNLGTMIGTITQPQLDALAPSVGAGMAHTENMLLMMKNGVQYQNAFALQQYMYLRGDQKLVKMWGIVVDMGTTNRRRPQFMTQALANSVIGGSMLQTVHSGANPTWDQPLSSDDVQLKGAHYLQSFAFINQGKVSTILFNLNQTSALPVTLSGPNAPTGSVQLSQIASANITDNNETADKVKQTIKTLSGFGPSTTLMLPPFSMTVLTATTSVTQPPSFSVAPGTYNATQTVVLSDATAGSTIYYTTDGSTPTTASPAYNGALTVSESETVQAIAVATGFSQSGIASATYVIQFPAAAAPTILVPSGLYGTAQMVKISDDTTGATIRYTTDGSVPTETSTAYTGAVTVSKSETLKAIAVASGFTPSAMTSATYVIGYPTSATPTFSVAPGTYTSAQSVVISEPTATAKVYYTTDGSVPSTASPVYAGPIIVGKNSTLKAIGAGNNLNPSAVVTAVYTIIPPAAKPTLSVPPATYSTTQTVSITDSTAGAVIYYTLNGTVPTTKSTQYSGPIAVAATETIEAIAVAPNFSPSAVTVGTYTITTGSTGGSSGFKKGEMVLDGSAKLVGSILELTDGGHGEIAAAWNAKKVLTGSFTTDFTFQLPKSAADGFTFTLQNASKGPYATGGNGDALGYAGIANSVAIKFDLYNGAKQAAVSQTGLLTNGENPPTQSINMASSNINLHNGHVFEAHLTYDGTTLVETVTDTSTGAVFTHSYVVNLPAILGGNSAYVGFTASTGGYTAIQNVLTWSYAGQANAIKKK